MSILTRAHSDRSILRIARCLAAAGCAGAATTAHAQCPVSIAGMPDFDQRRQGDLPGDGGMHCVPTSVVNIFAYFANRGIPQPLTLAGPRWWPSQAHYDRVSDTIDLMGTLMGTSASNGTTGGGGFNGASFYALAFAQGKVSVVHHWCGGGYCPTPARMFLAHAMGGFIAPCYGRYTESPTGFFTRNGGHCITMNGLDICASTLSFRDPASDSNNTTQSAFLTHTAGLVQRVAFFRGKSNQAYTLDARYRIDYGGGSSTRFLDGWFVLYPQVCLTNDQAQPPKIKLLRPFILQGTGLPAVQEFFAPAGTGAVKGIAIHPQQTDYFYMTAPIPGGPGKVFHLDPMTGISTERLASPGLGLMMFNRHGELYLTDGTSLKVFNMETTPPTQIGAVELLEIPEALAVDEEGDGIAAIVPTTVPTRKFLQRYRRDLGGTVPGGGLLPAAVAQSLIGDVSLAFADGSVLVASGSGTPSLFLLSSDSGGLLHTGTINLPAGAAPRAVNVDVHKHIFYTSNGVIKELMQGATGGWGPNPDSIFDGLPAGNMLYMARSTTNHLPELHEGPEWRNLPDPEIAPGVEDCYANCDESTILPVLNVDDFTCFINSFAQASALPRLEQIGAYANCDQSTIHPVLNVDDFTCFINRFAQGCP